MTGRRSAARDVGLAAFAYFVTMLGTTLPTPLYPALEQRFGFAELGTTLVFATYPVAVTAALVGCGHWSDLVGRRPMLLAGLALSALSAIAFLLPPSLFWVYAARVLSGLSAGIFTGTATATVVDLAHRDEDSVSGSAAGLVAASVVMGGLGAGPPLAGVLAQWVPHQLVLPFVVDLFLVALAVVCVLVLPETVERTRGARLAPQKVNVPREVRSAFVPAAIAGFAGFSVMGIFAAISPALLGSLLHLHEPALTGAVAGCVFGSSVIGQVTSVRLRTSRAFVLGCALLIAGMAGLGVSLLRPSLALLLAGGVVAGVGQGLSFRAGLTSVTDASPEEQRSEISSAFFVSMYIGIALPVVGFGILSTRVGLVPAGLAFTGLVALLAAVVLVLLVRRRSADPSTS